MSTNYYAFGQFPGGNRPGEGLHIGQTAAGWRFLFRAQPSLGITTIGDWLQFLARDGVTIENEYGREVSLTELEATMRETSDVNGRPLKQRFRRNNEHEYVTSGGHAFSRRDFC